VQVASLGGLGFRGLLGIKPTTVLGIRAHNDSVPALSPDHEGVSFPIINLFYMRS
jgi:hypothetical protein